VALSGTFAAIAAALLVTAPALAQTPSRVIRTIDQRCANCHQNPGTGRAPDVKDAPALARLRTLPPQRLLDSITTGSMRSHAEGVPDDVKRAMVEFLSGRKLAGTERADARLMTNRCPSAPPLTDVSATASWNGWAPDGTNMRFQRNAGLSSEDVPGLKLKWAFGFPGARSVYGQPSIAGGRVFVGVDTGYVYALDASTGCVHWSFQAEDGVRNAPSLGALKGATGPHAVYFGDLRANVYAVDAATGELLWQVAADPHPLAAITGAPTLHDGRLYVPVSSREEGPGSSLFYPCCTFRGSLVALDALTGSQVWKTYAIPEAPRPTKKNSAGTQQWAPAGGAVWHAPTVDPVRRAVYIATGDAYTLPAAKTTDAVMALDMDTGAVRWAVQDTPNDAWLVGCAQERTENCPVDLGPDYDFGASPMLVTLPNGRRLLLAGQKSGQVFAHDPDRNGAVAWTATPAGKLGAAEILFGGAADDRTAYFGLDNGVLAAIDIATGQERWSNPPAASARGGITAALTAIPGVVFAGGRDGMVRAFAADSGRPLWDYNTQQDVQTVNGVDARGGGMGAPGPTVAGGMLFVASGYPGLGNGTPGNVLLAFAAR
jgi:polyvinyl alcohol dehydrogenase (cytochrome)